MIVTSNTKSKVETPWIDCDCGIIVWLSGCRWDWETS